MFKSTDKDTKEENIPYKLLNETDAQKIIYDPESRKKYKGYNLEFYNKTSLGVSPSSKAAAWVKCYINENNEICPGHLKSKQPETNAEVIEGTRQNRLASGSSPGGST